MIANHLAALYGADAARELEREVHRLIAKFRPGGQVVSPALAPAGPGTERDVLLITYGDQVREPGERPLQTLRTFLKDHLDDYLSGVHVLPFFPYSSDDGFSVIDYFAVDPALGTWEDLAELGRSFDLMYDAVFNHMSAKSAWFQRFLHGDPQYADFFITVAGAPNLSQVVRPRALPLLTEFQTARGPAKVWTTFSADQVDLNFKEPRVLLAVLEALLFYVTHGAKLVRLDAIAYLWKEPGTSCLHLPQTHRVIQCWRAILDVFAPTVRLVTETNVPHRENLSYFGDGSNEAQWVYNFALPPLVLHALHTGDGTVLSRWAQTLRLPSRQVALFNFLASHDGIGLNPARGLLSEAEIDALVRRTQAHGGLVSYKNNPDGSRSPYELNITYFDALSDPNATESLETQIDRFMVAQAIMLALAGVPGIYFHSLFGSRNDRAAAEASGIPRRINRQKFWRTDLEAELSRPDSLRARVLKRYQALLRVRRAHAAFHPNGAQQIMTVHPGVFSVWRISPDETEMVLALHNLTSHPAPLQFPADKYASPGNWTDLFSGRRFDNVSVPALHLTLKPYEVIWLAKPG